MQHADRPVLCADNVSTNGKKWWCVMISNGLLSRKWPRGCGKSESVACLKRPNLAFFGNFGGYCWWWEGRGGRGGNSPPRLGGSLAPLDGLGSFGGAVVPKIGER
ncbi:unnamed protein product [Ectocarpus sp. 12 AP-2014]